MGLCLERLDNVFLRKELFTLDLATVDGCSMGSSAVFVKSKSTMMRVIYETEQGAPVQKRQTLCTTLPSPQLAHDTLKPLSHIKLQALKNCLVQTSAIPMNRLQ